MPSRSRGVRMMSMQQLCAAVREYDYVWSSPCGYSTVGLAVLLGGSGAVRLTPAGVRGVYIQYLEATLIEL